jgi:hypothetical protein
MVKGKESKNKINKTGKSTLCVLSAYQRREHSTQRRAEEFVRAISKSNGI